MLFNTEEGRAIPDRAAQRRSGLVAELGSFRSVEHLQHHRRHQDGKYFDLGPDDVILTVATDGADMYGSEIRKAIVRRFGNRFDAVAAGETWGRSLAGASVDHVLELTQVDRKRVFNLGYFTWVEQQGVSLEEFQARSRQSFWDGLLDRACAWDEMIVEFNAKSGAAAKLS